MTALPSAAPFDLRSMLRAHLVRRSLASLDESARVRRRAVASGVAEVMAWRDSIRWRVCKMLNLEGIGGLPLRARVVSRFEREHHVLENVLFESVEGWETNASIFLPLGQMPEGGWPAIVVPCGHSKKSDATHQLPCHVFARAGFAAILFDPPAQGGEKEDGNDHFRDGPRCYAVGQSSQRYFVGDAIRAMDYLQSREDIDSTLGFAMTGVSGGGYTTTWTSLVDLRVRAAAPVCCVASLADMPIRTGWPCCPETLPIGRLESGIDDADLLAALAPIPLLCISGSKDEVFTQEMFGRVTTEVKNVYSVIGSGSLDIAESSDGAGRFQTWVQGVGHEYSLEMARRTVAFFEAHWLGKTAVSHAASFSDSPTLEPAEAMRCQPSSIPNTRSITAARAAGLRRTRGPLNGRADALRAVRSVVPAVDAARAALLSRGQGVRTWRSEVHEVMLLHERDIVLPSTLLVPRDNPNQCPAAIVVFDDQGRWSPLGQQRWAAAASGFLHDRFRERPIVMSVDLRGWGDSTPAMGPYDLASWSGPDRWPSFVSASLGDGLLGQRVRDAVAATRWLIESHQADPKRLVFSGRGVGGVVALLAAAMFEHCQGVVCIDTPASLESIVASPEYGYGADVFQPGILEHLDLPDLVLALAPVLQIRPRDARGVAMSEESDYSAVEWIWRRMRLE